MGCPWCNDSDDRDGAGVPLCPCACHCHAHGSCAAYFFAESGGRWITIGGSKGEDGKRHGGSPGWFRRDGRWVLRASTTPLNKGTCNRLRRRLGRSSSSLCKSPALGHFGDANG
jgi:hypothetical protein